MNIRQRIELLLRLGAYMRSESSGWQLARQKAGQANNWFTEEFIDKACRSIAESFLHEEILTAFASKYAISDELASPKTVGLVMAGNIPLVGFHDWMCCFLSGHRVMVKASAKDDILIKHLVEQLHTWNAGTMQQVSFAPMLKGCDAYIATGSNNTARYFDFYFSKYPHIIRRNRTSAAIVTGSESADDLNNLADDIHVYFGLGCRNATKLYVPEGYDFVPLLEACRKYAYFANHHKYRNNYDYQLAIHLINNVRYMTNDSLLLSENTALFSPISQLNYEFYTDKNQLEQSLQNNNDIQCVIAHGYIPFGQAQTPSILDYADGVDTMEFLLQIK